MYMNQLDRYEPRNVFRFFEQICSIPHGSGNTDQIADFCVDFAKKRHLRYLRDDANNVILFKDGSVGYENAPAVILQGHLDMVCAKTPDNPIDMATQGLEVIVEGDWIHAVNTSLGGDNGIAVAMALAILDDDFLAHPPLEVVLTTDEETGMDGAFALDATPLQGRRMLNLDSEEEGIFTVSCAGGIRVEGVLPITRHTADGVRCSITVNGLLGGHSGVEIHKGRGNAIQLLGRLLHALRKECEFSILALNGGVVENAIPLQSTAEVLIPADSVAVCKAIIKQCETTFKNELATTDPAVTVTWCENESTKASSTDIASTDRILCMLLTAPSGVQVMSPDIPNLVQTSLNFGVLRLNDDALRATFSVRSSVESQKAMLRDRLICLFKEIGGTVTCSGEYPGWAYRKESPLRDLAVQSYVNLFGTQPQIVAIHAGLECGLFSEKLPGLDCISIGPNMKDIHTTGERLSISSTARTYQLVLDILKNSCS